MGEQGDVHTLYILPLIAPVYMYIAVVVVSFSFSVSFFFAWH